MSGKSDDVVVAIMGGMFLRGGAGKAAKVTASCIRQGVAILQVSEALE